MNQPAENSRFKPESKATKAIGFLKPVSHTTLSEQVALQLATELAAKRWQPGDNLPSEAELCRAFNVGRSTVREALRSLAIIGMIRTRAGGWQLCRRTSLPVDGSTTARERHA